MKFFSLHLSTLFGIGYIKFAPGTVASALTLLFWCVLVPEDYLVRTLLSLSLFLIGLLTINNSLDLHKDNDPQVIVIDEVVGMSIPLILFVEPLPSFIAFLIFRILDIFKPSIIYYSQFYKGAYGIMLDDILAGLITIIFMCTFI